ncbi:ABC transporter ATP-binding protein [Actinocorallia longicatena]|uniref:ABC transporter domain-containing protein n=1 Tax=Actinocorallia longicatena TaxID=111803 RepID=A0ABP6QN27_9ACTN
MNGPTAPAAATGPQWGASGVTVVFGKGSAQVTALSEVSFPVPRGQVAAVVGGDGAGKTTLLRTLVSRVGPVSGTVSAPPQRQCAFMPTGASGVWVDLSVEENLNFVGAAYGLTGPDLEQRKARLLETADLAKARDRLAGRLSGGMRQKLAFCMAMLHEPDLLVLDEPSTGVDPVSRVDLWRLISHAAAQGAAVAMATTYLDEAERASTVLVLDDGHVLAQGTPSEVLAATPGVITTGTAPAGDPDLSWRRGRAVHSWHPGPARPGENALTPDMEDSVIAATLARHTTAGGVT